MILDQTLTGSCLRVRKKDDYIGTDILVFDGGQMGSEMQEKVKAAWSSLITSSDPNLFKADNDKIRRFGVDLFFYTLMRNGFGFSPKTLMHLASMIVKYNAKYDSESTGRKEYMNYIDGLRNLKSVDEALTGSSVEGMRHIRNFLDQFIRNHSNNRQLIANIQSNDKRVSINGDTATITVPSENKSSALHDIMLSEDTPFQYITIITKIGSKLFSNLYRLDDTAGAIQQSGTNTSVTYKLTGELGVVNNFIEYNANLGTGDTVMESYFDTIRGASKAADEQQEDSKDYGGSEQAGDEVYDSYEEQQVSFRTQLRHLKADYISDKSAQGKAYRKALEAAHEAAEENGDNEVVQLFKDLLASKAGTAERATMVKKVDTRFKDKLAETFGMEVSQVEEEIKRIFEEQNKCGKG